MNVEKLRTDFKNWWNGNVDKNAALKNINAGEISLNDYKISITSGHRAKIVANNNITNSDIELFDLGTPDNQTELLNFINKKLNPPFGGRRRKYSRRNAFKVKSHRNRKSYKSRKSNRRH